jgi:hypothetical protein
MHDSSTRFFDLSIRAESCCIHNNFYTSAKEDNSHNRRISPKKFKWEQAQQEAWDFLISDYQNLSLYCLSTYPGMEDHSTLGIIIITDASDSALGYACFSVNVNDLPEGPVVVLDLCERGLCKLVGTGNRRLVGAERQYISFDKEGLGIFFALTKCRPIVLMAERTIVLSDSSNAINHLQTPGNLDVSLVRGKRWIRWLNDLSDLMYGPRAIRLQHIAAESNNLADFFSRCILRELNLTDACTQTDTDTIQPHACLATSLMIVSFYHRLDEMKNFFHATH